MRVQFFSGATLLGTVTFAGGELVTDAPALQGVIDAWVAQGKAPMAFVRYYADWSNGYISARRA